MKKIFIAPLFLSLLASLFSGCICNHCDHFWSDDYYFKNGLETPVIYAVLSNDTTGNTICFIVDTIQPDESIFVASVPTAGHGAFSFNESNVRLSNFWPVVNGRYHNEYRFIFGDSTYVSYSVFENDTVRKTPRLADFWDIIDMPKKNRKGEYKPGNYTLQYNIDEEDYRNALERNGSN